MFTVCPKCMLTLAVTANDLRMGQGYVRCGRCANVFNALLTLSEEPSLEEGSAPPTAADAATSSQITRALRDAGSSTAGGSSSGAAAAPATEPAGEPPPAAAGTAAASAAQVEPVPGPELRLPTERSSDGAIENESSFADRTGTFETIVLEGEAISQTDEYVPQESVDSELAALTQRLAVAAQEPVAAAAESPPAEAAAEAAAAASAAPPPVETGLEPAAVAVASSARWPWISGSALLLLLLLLQMLHHWRDALGASPLGGSLLGGFYAAIGRPLDPHWDLAAYDVRQQGAVIDAADTQVIRVRLSLANHALRAQPAPLLRLTLLDRYGKRVAGSDLTPEQYWPAGAAPRAYLAPEERIDSEIAVRDPSASSASFELDVCLRGAGATLHCATDASPAVP